MVYMLALHALVFWVMARWSHHGHGNASNLGAAELALLCQRQDNAAAAAAAAQPQGRQLLLLGW